MSIIYEVNLKVQADIHDEYLAWLKPHIKEILNFEGFISAQILQECKTAANTPDEISNEHSYSVRYTVDSMENLQNYLINHAAKMRQDGIDKFGDKFTATRRLLKVNQEFC